MEYTSVNLLRDCCWLALLGRPNTAAWHFTPFLTTRGSLRSTRTKSFRLDCKKRQGLKVSSMPHSWSMTLPSGNALPGIIGTGPGSEQVGEWNTCIYETYKIAKICFRPPQLMSSTWIINTQLLLNKDFQHSQVCSKAKCICTLHIKEPQSVPGCSSLQEAPFIVWPQKIQFLSMNH